MKLSDLLVPLLLRQRVVLTHVVHLVIDIFCHRLDFCFLIFREVQLSG